jgi:hypothetical protein
LPWGFVFREEEALLQDISGSRLRILLWHFSGAAVVGHVLASRKTGREQKEEEAICASFFFFLGLARLEEDHHLGPFSGVAFF